MPNEVHTRLKANIVRLRNTAAGIVANALQQIEAQEPLSPAMAQSLKGDREALRKALAALTARRRPPDKAPLSEADIARLEREIAKEEEKEAARND